MTPAIYNITIPQNATFELNFQLKGSDGTPLNMAGYEVLAQLWTANKTSKLGEFTINWIDRAIGKFNISLTPENTAAIVMVGFWDLLVTEPGGNKHYWVRGKVSLSVGYTVDG